MKFSYVLLQLYVSISKDVFKVNTPNVIKTQNIISDRLITMKDVLPAYEEYLIFCNDIITYQKRPGEPMSMANRIQRKMSRLKSDRDMLLCCFRVGDRLYEFENMEKFHIIKKIERNHVSQGDQNHRRQEIENVKLRNKFFKTTVNEHLFNQEDPMGLLCDRCNSSMCVMRDESFMACQKCGYMRSIESPGCYTRKMSRDE